MENKAVQLTSITSTDLKSVQLHEHILRSLGEGVHVIDLNGTVLMENAASARMLGWCGDCLEGKSGHEAIHHHHADGTEFPAHECPIYATLQDGIAREVSDDVFWRQDGSFFPVEYSTAPLCNADGNCYGVTVVFRDITERKRAQQMQDALHQIAECAHDCGSPEALYPQLYQIIAALLPVRKICVALLDESRGQLDFPYVAQGQDVLSMTSISLSEGGLIADVVRAGKALLLGRSPSSGSIAPEMGAADWLGVPLTLSHQVMGALVVQNEATDRRYTEADQSLLQFVSTQLATSIDRALRDARLRQMAQFDALTGLPNRALFGDRLQIALGQSIRRREQLALMYLDLDKFKPVNDVHGHAMGDALLVEVARRIRLVLRASDTVGRVGGDEFVIVLHPISSAVDAAEVAEKVRQTLALPFELNGIRIDVSTSIGIAHYPQHGVDSATLTCAADNAMYQAKRDGGNRYVIAQ